MERGKTEREGVVLPQGRLGQGLDRYYERNIPTDLNISKICEGTGLSTQKTRTLLKLLEKSQFLTIKSTNKYSIITVCNYDSYVDEGFKANKQTNKQLTNNQQTTNNNIRNNRKNINNILLSLSFIFFVFCSFFVRFLFIPLLNLVS